MDRLRDRWVIEQWAQHRADCQREAGDV